MLILAIFTLLMLGAGILGAGFAFGNLRADLWDLTDSTDLSFSNLEDMQDEFTEASLALREELTRVEQALLQSVQVQSLIVERLLALEKQTYTPETFARALLDSPLKPPTKMEDLCNNG